MFAKGYVPICYLRGKRWKIPYRELVSVIIGMTLRWKDRFMTKRACQDVLRVEKVLKWNVEIKSL